VCNGGYYSFVSENAKQLKILERISTFFIVKDENLSVGPRILCKTCYWRIQKFEATVNEVANLNWQYYKKNLVCWKGEATNDEDTYLKCCSSSSGTPASEALCSSTQSPGITWNNNDFPIPVGKTVKTSLLRKNSQFHPYALRFSCRHRRTFWELLSWLWPDLDLSQTLQRVNKHQPQTPPATIITSPSDTLQAHVLYS